VWPADLRLSRGNTMTNYNFFVPNISTIVYVLSIPLFPFGSENKQTMSSGAIVSLYVVDIVVDTLQLQVYTHVGSILKNFVC
jgi:hypothetical protein